PHLGQPRWASELVDRALALPAWSHAALYAPLGILAQSGRIAPADHRPPSTRRPASPDTQGDHQLVGRDRGGLERGSNAVYLGRQAQRATGPGATTRTGWLRRRNR